MKYNTIRLRGLTDVMLPIHVASRSDVYILKDADGLGPSEVDVSIGHTRHQGGVYQGRRPQNKELTLKVGLNAQYVPNTKTVEQLREELYGLLSPGVTDSVQVMLMNGENELAYIDGYVKRIEPVIFAKDPEVQIVIPCTQAYFIDVNLVNTVPTLVTPTPNNYSWKIVNQGSFSTGFRMLLNFNDDSPFFALVDSANQKIELNEEFLAGEGLLIDTNYGTRQIARVTEVVGADGLGTVYTNLISALTTDSVFLQLHKGDNIFYTPSISADGDVSDDYFSWDSVEYTPKYWGV